MSAIMIDLLDFVFFLFDKQDNPIVFIPFAVIYFCFSLSLVRVLVRGV